MEGLRRIEFSISSYHLSDKELETGKMKAKSKNSEEIRWATQLVRERMKDSQAITHLGFDVQSVEKGRAVFQLDVLAHQGGRARAARGEKFCRDGVRDFQRERVAGRKGTAHLRSSRRAFSIRIERLLLAVLGGTFSLLVNVLDHALEDKQVGATLARELDAITVVPFDGAAEHLAILANDGHWRVRLHLLDPVEILRVSRLRWRGLLAGDRAVVRRAGNARLFHVRKARTKHTAVDHNCSF